MRTFRPVLSSLVVLALLPMASRATRVYQSTGPDGSTVFSDQPSPQARQIDINLPASDLPPAVPPKPDAPARPQPVADKAVVYTTLRITQPANDAVFWFAEGPVKVQAEIVPPLAEGHVLVPLLNGVAQGSGVAAHGFSLTGLDPDTYELVVVIRDADGRDLKRSPAVRFHFKRQSLNLPARRPPPRGGN